MEQDTDRIKYLEKSIERTLTLAEAAAEETKNAATAQAEQLIHQAKLEAQEILTNARTKAYAIEQDILALENRYELMKTRVKLLLYAEIELLDKDEIRGGNNNEEPLDARNRCAAAVCDDDSRDGTDEFFLPWLVLR